MKQHVQSSNDIAYVVLYNVSQFNLPHPWCEPGPTTRPTKKLLVARVDPLGITDEALNHSGGHTVAKVIK